jgi:geranylgeranyl pyrophosphate synthase
MGTEQRAANSLATWEERETAFRGAQDLVREELSEVEATLSSVSNAELSVVRRMLEHVLGGEGKRLRPTIALLAGRFGTHRPQLLVPLAASIELLHTATLVHDDVIDESDTRRGRETTNARHHNAAAVMLGDYMFAHAAELICRTDSLDVVRLFSATLMAMASGELSQDMTAYDYNSDTVDYLNRTAGKTASLFATSAQGGALIAGAAQEWQMALRNYGENVGMAFQIVDDILDFDGSAAELGKPVGSDLMAGTLTLPSLLLMERYPDSNPIRRLFEEEDGAGHLAEAVAMIHETGIMEASYGVVADFLDRAHAALTPLPSRPELDALHGIADYVASRRS